MQPYPADPAHSVADDTLVANLLRQCLARDEFAVPSLPDVAVQVVRIGTKDTSNAEQLSDIIERDRSLSRVLFRIAASAANRPVVPIGSLRHAIAWLGLNEVTNIAFTLALQGRLLHVPGQQSKARKLWRHALASALWSRQLAQVARIETGPSYLCGLLHGIGKIVTLGTAYQLARSCQTPLSSDDYERLIEVFHRDVGLRVIAAWQLPGPALAVATRWQDYATAGAERFIGNIVNVAHQLADYTVLDRSGQARDILLSDAAYRDLGPQLGDGVSLFDSVCDIDEELDRYLCP
jgi:HD-like signal output (HDOD) protein